MPAFTGSFAGDAQATADIAPITITQTLALVCMVVIHRSGFARAEEQESSACVRQNDECARRCGERTNQRGDWQLTIACIAKVLEVGDRDLVSSSSPEQQARAAGSLRCRLKFLRR
jgi:hypothetical protein